MRRPAARRRAVLLGLALLTPLLAGCPKQPPDLPTLARPEWAMGDLWIFRRTPTIGTPIIVTHEVIASTPEGYTMRITRLGQELVRHWTRELALRDHEARGRPVNSFDPPLPYFVWPLAAGKTWRHEFEYRDGQRDGRYTNSWRAAKEAEPVSLTAGFFAALRVERLGGDGQRLEGYWYAPAVRYWVRLEDDVNNYVEELVEYRPSRQ